MHKCIKFTNYWLYWFPYASKSSNQSGHRVYTKFNKCQIYNLFAYSSLPNSRVAVGTNKPDFAKLFKNPKSIVILNDDTYYCEYYVYLCTLVYQFFKKSYHIEKWFLLIRPFENFLKRVGLNKIVCKGIWAKNIASTAIRQPRVRSGLYFSLLK